MKSFFSEISCNKRNRTNLILIAVCNLILIFHILGLKTTINNNCSISSSFMTLFIIYFSILSILFINNENLTFMISKYTSWIDYIVQRIDRKMNYVVLYLVITCLIIYITNLVNIIELIQFFCYQCLTSILFELIIILFEKKKKKNLSYLLISFIICSCAILNSEELINFNLLYGIYYYYVQMNLFQFALYSIIIVSLIVLLIKIKDIEI